jgi:rhodanese-related sulfurtransferase
MDAEAQFLLLDCRNQEEFDLVHLPDAVLIPMGQLAERVDELDVHKTSHIVVYCHLGGRSQMVTEWLRQQGFEGVQNMMGGIDGWAVQIDQNVRRY